MSSTQCQYCHEKRARRRELHQKVLTILEGRAWAMASDRQKQLATPIINVIKKLREIEDKPICQKCFQEVKTGMSHPPPAPTHNPEYGREHEQKFCKICDKAVRYASEAELKQHPHEWNRLLEGCNECLKHCYDTTQGKCKSYAHARYLLQKYLLNQIQVPKNKLK